MSGRRRLAMVALLQVRLHVKVAEQRQERDHVDDQKVVHPQREVAVVVECHAGSDNGERELNLFGQ